MEVQVYRRRWFMLLLFCLFSCINAFSWIYFAIIPDVLVDYFHLESTILVDLMSLVFMITYIPFIFPGIWLIEKKGLKIPLLLGTFGTAAGSWLKALVFCPDCYAACLTGQTIVAISQIFVLGIPAPLAAVWFPDSEVATATAIGVFGNQVGIALGFLLPPILVPYSEDLETMGWHLRLMLYEVAAITTAIFLLILFFFQNTPKKPPSVAQFALVNSGPYNIKKSLINLMKSRGFVLLLASYGINVGAFYCISTLLGQIVTESYENSRDDAGRIGLLIVVTGMAGSVICGYILDKSKKFKLITTVIYILSFCSLILYTFTMGVGGVWVVYVTSSILGFFMTGYFPLGFEFAAEITYPEPESSTSGLLNASAQIFGIIFTLSAAKIKEYSILGSNLYMCVALFIGSILTVLIREKLKRHEANNVTTDKEMTELTEETTMNHKYNGTETNDNLNNN